MDYKVVIADEDFSEDEAHEIFQRLQEMVIDGKNIDIKNPAPFIVEGLEAVLIGTTWGVSRPDVEDMQELSSLYPDLTFHFIQASQILNGNHFENLKNYSLSVYEDGELREVFKPEPIVWKSSKMVEFLPNPWA